MLSKLANGNFQVEDTFSVKQNMYLSLYSLLASNIQQINYNRHLDMYINEKKRKVNKIKIFFYFPKK